MIIELNDKQIEGLSSLARHVYKQNVLDCCVSEEGDVRIELIKFLRQFYESEYWR